MKKYLKKISNFVADYTKELRGLRPEPWEYAVTSSLLTLFGLCIVISFLLLILALWVFFASLGIWSLFFLLPFVPAPFYYIRAKRREQQEI